MEWEKILTELTFRTSRSSGAGGQHVNKTETKVEVLFNVQNSVGLSEEEKAMISRKLSSSISMDGNLAVSSQKSRSQFANKDDVITKLKAKLDKSIIPRIKRVRTKPSKVAVEERLNEKKIKSKIKADRKKPEI